MERTILVLRRAGRKGNNCRTARPDDDRPAEGHDKSNQGLTSQIMRYVHLQPPETKLFYRSNWIVV